MINNYIKDYGIFVLVYILFITILIIKFNYIKQSIMITLLLISYLYYNTYYSSISELVNNTKEGLNKVSKGEVNLINKENNNHNLNIEKNSISHISSTAMLNNIKTQVYKFIDEYIPIESRKALQVKQQNNREVIKEEFNKLINKYFKIIYFLINTNSEELNYYQQLKNIEKEILTLIHNTIFLNHKSDKEAEKLINNLQNIFINIQKELSAVINNKNTHHQKDFIPTINEFKASNNYEDNILF
jgi:hypothetical protein